MKKHIRFWIYSLFAIAAFLMFTNSCKEDEDNNNTNSSGTVTDIDGNVYNTVTIGTQVWMAENLKTTKYRNGDPIPNITDNAQWSKLTTGAQCSYNNDDDIGNKYGKLYNWYAVNDSRNIAPIGWHVSSNSDLVKLENYVSANLGNSGSLAKALASKTDWFAISNIDNAVGNDLTKNNSSGFSVLPGGNRISNGGFHLIGELGVWWCSDESGTDRAWSSGISYSFRIVSRGDKGFKLGGSSVRCVKD